MKRTIHPLLLSVISGVLLPLGWTGAATGPALLAGFVPLLMAEYRISNEIGRFPSFAVFINGFIAFLVWCTIVLWGALYVSIVALCACVLVTTLFMSITFWLFHQVRRKLGDGFGYFALIVFWLCFEYFYQEGEISFPWLNLGSGLSNNIHIIQWYEYTGVFGGSLWILLSNVLIFRIIINYLYRKERSRRPGLPAILAVTILFPVAVSIIMFYTYHEKSAPCEIVILQPNLDPYKEKFDTADADIQTDILLRQADSLTGENTRFIIAPETAIPEGVWLDQINDNKHITGIIHFLREHPDVRFIAGMNTSQLYPDKESASGTAHIYYDGPEYFDYYNSALQLESDGSVQVCHKSKLLIGPEKMPYSHLFGFMESLVVDMGGFVGSNGIQEQRTVFSSEKDTVRVAPVICYESVFGDYITEYIQKGAHFIAVITNDGWWSDSPIYKQHLGFSRLRAVETRRSIARSANTGTSCFINQRGEIPKRTEFWKRTAISGEINANDTLTFYVRNGDFIPRTAVFFGIIILLYMGVNSFKKRKV
ncbi:MAG: apolipoprotein N-acyltransferase [Bacteroidetes bacterium]|nr:apolipoprotein N-acyltransferase [Bacteroidota bacterium]